MKKRLILFSLLALLMMQVSPALALTSGEAKQEWLNLQQERMNLQTIHRQAKLDYAADKNPENEKKVIDTAKDVFNKVLDEAEIWLEWKNLEAQEDPRVPSDIKQSINNDVEKNKTKIYELRLDVAGVDSGLEAIGVFIKMAASYLELLTDVARNVGSMWVHIGNSQLETAFSYESELRAIAVGLEDSADIIAKLDIAKSELDTARAKVGMAEEAYKKVVLPGTPLIKFNEGNGLLRQAKNNLLTSQLQLESAYLLIIAK